jgi:hypothetical protein
MTPEQIKQIAALSSTAVFLCWHTVGGHTEVIVAEPDKEPLQIDEDGTRQIITSDCRPAAMYFQERWTF